MGIAETEERAVASDLLAARSHDDDAVEAVFVLLFVAERLNLIERTLLRNDLNRRRSQVKDDFRSRGIFARNEYLSLLVKCQKILVKCQRSQSVLPELCKLA